jgi:hypothetical protein
VKIKAAGSFALVHLLAFVSQSAPEGGSRAGGVSILVIYVGCLLILIADHWIGNG